MNKKKINYITDVLTQKDVQWMLDYKDGFTLLVAPTGTGKSTFIIEDIIKPNFTNHNHGFGEGKYYQFAENKILVMANRTAVVLKFNSDVEKAIEEMGIFRAEGVTVASYQKISDEDMLKLIDEHDIIICDEAHYFISDAWNGTTGIIINKILEASESKPVMFFTATPQLINKYFNYRGITNYKELNYTELLGFNDRMNFICTNKRLEQIIKQIPKNEKILVFVADMTRRSDMKKLKEKYEKMGYEVEFYHSMWERGIYGNFTGKKDPEMQDKVYSLVHYKKFNTQIAIANKAIDNGIDLKDFNLKHIILLNQFDHVQILQMIGRKRFDIHDESDGLTVWFSNEGNGLLNHFYKIIAEQIEFMNKYREYSLENFEAIKTGLSFIPCNKNKSENEMRKLTTETTIESFLEENENRKTLNDLRLEKELLPSDEFIGLSRYQLSYLAPLTNKYLIDVENDDGTYEAEEKQNIVKNYEKLVKLLFERNAEIQWRNKDEVAAQRDMEFERRVTEELVSHLTNFEGVKLYDGERRKFQFEMSYYYGVSKRSDRLSSLTTIREFINAHGFTIDRKVMSINKKQQTVWIISKI